MNRLIQYPYPPQINRAERAALTPCEMEEKYGVRIRADVAKLWMSPQYHKRLAQKCDEWIHLRRRYITGSRVAAILGYNAYQSRREMYFDYIEPQSGFTGNANTNYGVMFEDAGVYQYERVMAIEGGSPILVLPFDFLVSPEHPEQFAYSPDGITSDGNLIEVKVPVTRAIIPGVVPEEYHMGQIQFGMYNFQSFGVHHCDFIEYEPPRSWTFPESQVHVTRLPRIESWGAQHVSTLLEFWNEVMDYHRTGNVNEKYGNDMAKRCRKYSQRARRRPNKVYTPTSYGPPPPPDYFVSEQRFKKWFAQTPLDMK